MIAFLICIIFIMLLIILYFHSRINYLSRYSIFLEDEYFNFINKLIGVSEEERKQLLLESKKTNLYKKIRLEKSDTLDRFRMMYDD